MFLSQLFHKFSNFDKSFFSFSSPYMIEKIFLYQIFKMNILMDFQVLRSLEYEKSHFQRLVCVYLCVSVISITQKQVTAESSNMAFYICNICRCYLNFFIKTGQKLCVQGHTNEFYYGLWTKFIVSEFQFIQTALNIMKLAYIFCHV